LAIAALVGSKEGVFRFSQIPIQLQRDAEIGVATSVVHFATLDISLDPPVGRRGLSGPE
jgi:hypothetical protein